MGCHSSLSLPPAYPLFSLEDPIVNDTPSIDRLTDTLRQLERQERQLRRKLHQARKEIRFYRTQLQDTRNLITGGRHVPSR